MYRHLTGLAVLLLALAGWHVQAAQAAGGDEASLIDSWGAYTPPSWPIAINMPAWGELLEKGVDAETDKALGTYDSQWTDTDDEGTEQPYQVVAYNVPIDGLDQVADGDWGEFDTGVDQGISKDLAITSRDLNRGFGGERWMQYNLISTDAAADPALKHTLCVTLQPGGAFAVLFSFADQGDEAIEAALEACLGEADA